MKRLPSYVMTRTVSSIMPTAMIIVIVGTVDIVSRVPCIVWNVRKRRKTVRKMLSFVLRT